MRERERELEREVAEKEKERKGRRRVLCDFACVSSHLYGTHTNPLTSLNIYVYMLYVYGRQRPKGKVGALSRVG